jgi:hypothetical protein
LSLRLGQRLSFTFGNNNTMNTKQLIARLLSGAVCALMGYLLYEMIHEVSSSPDGIAIQDWISIFITVLLLFVLVPLSCYLWRCDRNGIMHSLLFIGAITIFFLFGEVYRLLSPQLEHTPSSVRLISSILFLIAPFCLPVIFYRWGTKKLLAEQVAASDR